MIALLLARQEFLVVIRPEEGLCMAHRLLLLLDVLSSVGVQDIRVEDKFLSAVRHRIVLYVASMPVPALLVVGGRGVLFKDEILLVHLDLICLQLSRSSILLLIAQLVALGRLHVV